MRLVAGIDSSTQACKVTVREAATGRLLREGKASHPDETIVDPEVWWRALLSAVDRAGGLRDVAAIAVAGQQHTPVFLGADGTPTAPSPLWNDTGSHPQTEALNHELGRDEWIRRTGLPITLSDTVTKVRWLRDVHPRAAERTAAVAVLHDWLTWRLRGHGSGTGGIELLTTDRSEASGTAYWSGTEEDYCRDLFAHALGHDAALPRVLEPLEIAGSTGEDIPGVAPGVPIAAGAGDNAAAALALGLAHEDAVMSIGTSGVVYARSATSVHDYAGYVCGYADATGGYLPLVATLNAARNLHLGARLLGCSYDELSHLALRAAPGAEGLTLLPFFAGERTPDLPDAHGSLHGASLSNLTRENFARAVVEGTLASQVAMLDALHLVGIDPRRLLLIGGAAKNPAVQKILPTLIDVPIAVPAPDEYVAKGAAMQAAAAISGEFPAWPVTLRELPEAAVDQRVSRQRQRAMVDMGYRALSMVRA